MTSYLRIGSLMLALLWGLSCAPVKKAPADTAANEQKPIKIDRLPPTPKSAKPDTSARKSLLQERIEAALKHVADREIHTTHSSWTIFHGILGVGKDLTLLDRKSGDRVKALDVICERPEEINGLQFIDDHPWGVDVPFNTSPGIGQGHQDQYVAELAQQGIPLTQPILLPRFNEGKVIGREKHTFADLILFTKNRASVKQGQELSWTIMVLSHFYGTDFEWTNRFKEKWHFTDLVRAELEAPVATAACGGTHRLFGLTWALHVHVKNGGKVEGIWKKVADRIEEHEKLAKKNQNLDGTFSTEYVCNPNDPNNPADNVRRINTTGHVLEWLALSLTTKELREPWVEDAANALSLLILGCQNVDLESGSLYHAAHGLQMYYARVYGKPAGFGEKHLLPPPPDEPKE